MNILQRGILLLLKSAVTGERCLLPEGFSLEDAVSVIEKHGLATLAYQGAVNCGIDSNSPLMLRLFQNYYRQLLRSEKQMRAVERLYAAFEENGIDYLPLKGCNMKLLYPKPELRIMGDADILIRMEQYDRIRPVVEQLGFTEQQESDHEYIWHSDALHLELHKRLIPSYNRDYYAYFGDGWRLAKKQNGYRYAMSAEDDFVYLFTHFAKHYRDGGIGCRHVLDLWVYRTAHPRMDWRYVRAELRKLELLEFHENVCCLLALWFGDGAESDKLAYMTDFIFDSGSWGKWESHVLAAGARNRQTSGSALGGRIKGILKVVFPALKDMSVRYTVLKRAPWLLPVMWPVRWVDALLFRRANVRKNQMALQTATAEKVDDYQRSLQYVGLDFRFEE